MDDSAYNPTLRPRFDVGTPVIVVNPRRSDEKRDPNPSLGDGDAALLGAQVRSQHIARAILPDWSGR
jgi:hypothetical protein